MRWFAEAGTAICWTGTDGTPVYATGVGPRDTSRMSRQAMLVAREDRHLALARRLRALRTGARNTSLSLDQWRGEEGAWMQACYQSAATMTGLSWQGRVTSAPWDALDTPNVALSSVTPLLYGVLWQVCLAAGVAPGLGIVHQHTARALVYDLADVWKGQWLVPLVFHIVAAGNGDRAQCLRATRDGVRDAMRRHEVFARSLDAVERLFDMPLAREDRPDPELEGWVVPRGSITCRSS